MNFKKNKKMIAIVSIAIIVVILIIILAVVNSNKPVDEEKISSEYEETIENNTISKLANMTEMERAKTYLSDFVKMIEAKNWEEAYEKLYPEFKENYFKSEVDFKEYCQNYFPEIFAVTNKNVERINNIYVLETKIADMVNNTKGFGLYFVIRENALNDYDISFSVNSAIESENNR